MRQKDIDAAPACNLAAQLDAGAGISGELEKCRRLAMASPSYVLYHEP